MGRAPCCGDHEGLKRGPWTAEEDQQLIHCVQSHGLGNWRTVPKLSGLSRCGKSCRLRWANYLRPDIKRGPFSMHEDLTIIRLHAVLGNKWSVIASNLPGRTDNEVKNHWNTKLKKRLLLMGIDPVTHMSLPTPDMLSCLMASSSTAIAAPLNNALAEAQLGQLVRDCENITHPVSTGSGYEYSWQLSPILHLLAMHNNPLWTHPSESLTSVVPMDLSTLDWNSMPNLMPSNIPDHKNDHRYCYVSNKKSSSTTISSSYKGGSEIPENTIHYHRDDTFGSAIRTARSDQRLEEDESSYWLRLLNSIDDSNGDPTNYIKLHLPSP